MTFHNQLGPSRTHASGGWQTGMWLLLQLANGAARWHGCAFITRLLLSTHQPFGRCILACITCFYYACSFWPSLIKIDSPRSVVPLVHLIFSRGVQSEMVFLVRLVLVILSIPCTCWILQAGERIQLLAFVNELPHLRTQEM